MEINQPYAEFHHRMLAHNIDFVILLALFFIINLIFPNFNHDLVLVSILFLGYNIGFELSPSGRTLGKKIMNINIYCENGSKPTVFQIIIRNFAKILSMLLFFGGFAFILVDGKRRGLHDLFAKTVLTRTTN